MRTFFAVFFGIIAAALVLWLGATWYSANERESAAEKRIQEVSEVAETLCRASAASETDNDETRSMIEEDVHLVWKLENDAELAPGHGGIGRSELLENKLHLIGCLQPQAPGSKKGRRHGK